MSSFSNGSEFMAAGPRFDARGCSVWLG